MTFRNELGTTIQNQVGHQVVHGDINYIGFGEHDKLRDQCLRDLLLEDPRATRDALKARKGGHAAGTCDWFLRSNEIMTWRDSDSATNDIFWLSGNPGTGKSTLMIHLVDALETAFTDSKDCAVAYFFCDTSVHYQNTAIAILRGLVYQLCRWSKYLLDKYLLLEYRAQGSKLIDSFSALWRIFKSMSMDRTSGQVYVVIDALDECDENSQDLFLQHFRQSYGQTNRTAEQPSFHFLITSRPYQNIWRALTGFPHKDLASFPEIAQDIDLFIEETVSKLARVGYTRKLQQEATEIFRTKAEGTFLWVGLAYTEIKDISVMDGLAQLRDLPTGLSEMYRSLLHKALSRDERRKAHFEAITTLLTVVAIALEPMTIADLAVACSLYAEEDFDERILFVTELVSMCGFMVVMDGDYVRMLHKSVKDFIFKKADDIFPAMPVAHAELASTCVDRLLSYFRTQKSSQGLQKNNSLVEYAVKHWPSHAHLAERYYAIKLPVQAEFFSHHSQSRDAWLTYALAMGEDISLYFSLFHVAARWDIVALLEHTKSERFFNTTGTFVKSFTMEEFNHGFNTFRGNPLEVAASSDNARVFRKLLSLKARDDGQHITLSYEEDPEPKEEETADSEGCFQFPVTPRVIKLAVRNKKIGLELLNVLWRQRREQLKLTHDIVIDMVKFLSADDFIVRLMFRELVAEIKVDRAILNAAAANERSSKDLLMTLLDLRGEHSEIDHDMVWAAAQQFDAMTVQKVLQYCSDEVVITADLAMAVATNKVYAFEVMAFLRQEISGSIVEQSQDFRELLFKHSNLHSIQEFFDLKTIEVNERLMCAAVKNTIFGYDIAKELVTLSSQSHITSDVLMAAASNQNLGKEILILLLKFPNVPPLVTSSTITLCLHYHKDLDLLLQLVDCLEKGAAIGNDLFQELFMLGHLNIYPEIIEQMVTKLMTNHVSSITTDGFHTIDAILMCQTPLKYIKILLSNGKSVPPASLFFGRSIKFSLESIQEILSLVEMGKKDWSTLIEKAVANSRSDILESLVFDCKDTVQRTSRLEATAFAAAQHGQIEILESVLNQGIDLNNRYDTIGGYYFNIDKLSLIETAIYNNQLGVFNILLDNGVDLGISGGSEKLSKLLRSFPATVVRERGTFKYCPEHLRAFINHVIKLDTEAHLRKSVLDIAISEGDFESVRLLIDSGIDLNSYSRREPPPISIALSPVGNRNTAKMVALLLDKGADIDSRGDIGGIVHLAINNNNLLAAHILMLNGASPPKVFLPNTFSPRFDVSDLTYLLRNKARTEQHERSLETDSVVSPSDRLPTDLEICQTLHDADFDFSSRGKWNRTMLIEAVLGNLPDHVRWLLSIGVDINAADQSGYTALHYSVQRSLVITRILYYAGAELRTVSAKGETVIHCASASGKIDVLRWVIGLFSQDFTSMNDSKTYPSETFLEILNRIDDVQRTALHLSLYNGHADVVELLKSKGARLDIPDHNGLTAQALELVSSRYRHPALQFLFSGPHSVSTLDIKETLRKIKETFGETNKEERAYRRRYSHMPSQLIGHQMFDEARTACEIQLRSSDSREALIANCRSCAFFKENRTVQRSSARFFRCKVCPRCWVCEICWYRRWSFSSKFCCFDHVSDFMQIPGPSWPGIDSKFVNDRQETEEEWIERLCQFFEVDQETSSSRKRKDRDDDDTAHG